MHIVVNNQIGFHHRAAFLRSSPYPTDIALMVEAPIFHVNGDDPEAVVHAAKVATEFRQKFHKDVVIDIFCYRRFGHNEGDEPMFTNPLMYKKIKKQKTTLSLYTDELVKDGLIPEGEIEDMKAAFQAHLNEEFEAGKTTNPTRPTGWMASGPSRPRKEKNISAAKPRSSLKHWPRSAGASTAPDDFPLHKTVGRLLEAKAQMFETRRRLRLGHRRSAGLRLAAHRRLPRAPVRPGRTRGTFSQRHSGLINQDTEERYYPLNHIREGQAQYEVIDSMLSEYAVLGFEYGYSLAEPNALTLWEAQFGDFANGAQIMFDQFIISGESKWLRMSGLVCLLPHGYEGQGPEHSRPP